MRRNSRAHYELRADSVVVMEGDETVDTIPIADVARWINYDDPWIAWTVIELKDGQQMQLHDPDLQLEGLLIKVIPEKMTYASENS